MNTFLDNQKPDIKISVRQTFNLDSDMEVNGFFQKISMYQKLTMIINLIDTILQFCPVLCLIKVLVQGYHGTGKSTHIEQVAARLNWPCVK